MGKCLIIFCYNHINQEFETFVQDLDNICKILKIFSFDILPKSPSSLSRRQDLETLRISYFLIKEKKFLQLYQDLEHFTRLCWPFYFGLVALGTYFFGTGACILSFPAIISSTKNVPICFKILKILSRSWTFYKNALDTLFCLDKTWNSFL